MPPRKKAKIDHPQEGTTTSTGRTTRARSKAANAVTAADASDVQPPDVASAAPGAAKLQRGCLKDILNFAIEIQLMIFENLHPQDLFNLSRTAKIFHGFFLHHSNEVLWEAALKNADDLPTRPPWMSIPSFIHLLYLTRCHNCGCPNIRKVVIWEWFARFCSKCLPSVTYDSPHVERRFSDSAGCTIYRDYVLHRIDAPTTAEPRDRSYERYVPYWNLPEKINWYLKRDVDELIAQWSALPQPVDSDAAKAIQTQYRKDFVDRRKHAAQCEGWYLRREEDRKDDLRNGRIDRFWDIVDKLKEEGWKKDLDFLGSKGLEKMSCFPVVRQSAKLTNKGWEKVQKTLRGFLTETRKARLQKEREDLIRHRFAELDAAIIAHCVTIPRDATMVCHPLALDFALSSDIEPLVNAPSSKDITCESFTAMIPKLVTGWEARQRKYLKFLLGQFITEVPASVDILDLAISVVYMGTRSGYDTVRTMRYPYLLARSPFRSIDPRDHGSFMSGHYAAPVVRDRGMGPFDLKKLDEKRVEVGIKWMRNIVTKLGLDADTATLADLERCEARVRCLKCAEEGENSGAYTWEAAFAHTAKHNTTRFESRNAYPRSSHNRWGRVNKADMPKVKEREAVAHALMVGSNCVWSCALHNIEDADGAITDGTIFWSPIDNTDFMKVKKPAVDLC
ncbi:hypothetical protein GSI_12721 [Ganoderma sinense ZZ0214-1]|uniref:F-box domain-containing protein n=1 Tax=Ganoderma sinense ZZ0214-1 TaxID=1077348 RepID=A0A2G8RTI8_9APHY|nr:hypothetical protein GSI_12721 [Ganoderma sinense ZZ0214-1]